MIAVGDVGAHLGADHEHGAEMPALDDLDQVFHYAWIVQWRGGQSGGTQDVSLCDTHDELRQSSPGRRPGSQRTMQVLSLFVAALVTTESEDATYTDDRSHDRRLVAVPLRSVRDQQFMARSGARSPRPADDLRQLAVVQPDGLVRPW